MTDVKTEKLEMKRKQMKRNILLISDSLIFSHYFSTQIIHTTLFKKFSSKFYHHQWLWILSYSFNSKPAFGRLAFWLKAYTLLAQWNCTQYREQSLALDLGPNPSIKIILNGNSIWVRMWSARIILGCHTAKHMVHIQRMHASQHLFTFHKLKHTPLSCYWNLEAQDGSLMRPTWEEVSSE